jgi:hypothetical protein
MDEQKVLRRGMYAVSGGMACVSAHVFGLGALTATLQAAPA